MFDAGQFRKIAEQNELQIQREYNEGQTSLNTFPCYIQIGADNRCNLRCGFCMAAAYREEGLLHIQDRKLERNPLELFQRLVPWMPYWRFLSLTGPGESLLNPRLDQILKLVRENSACTLLITTNGVLIKERLARIFMEYRVDEIAVSLDSLCKKTYEELRINARFEDAIGAIEILNREKAKENLAWPRVSVTPNFMHRNIRELPDFIDFAHRHGLSSVKATPTQIYRKDWVQESLLHYPELTRQMAEEAERRALRLNISFENGLRMIYLNRGRGVWGFLKKREPVDFPTDPAECLKPWNSLYIEPDGEVRPCCYQSPVYGNLFETDFVEMWNGPQARELRRGMLENDLPRACRECYEFNRHDPSIMVQTEVLKS